MQFRKVLLAACATLPAWAGAQAPAPAAPAARPRRAARAGRPADGPRSPAILRALLPMALSHDIGSETQRPLAIVVIGGLITATY